MADYTSYCLQDKNELKALGNAIRSKAGVSGTLTVPEMTDAVKNMSIATAVGLPTVSNSTISPSLIWNKPSKATSMVIYQLTNTGIKYVSSTQNDYAFITYAGAGAGGSILYTIPRRYAARAITSNGMGTALTAFEGLNVSGCVFKNCRLHGHDGGCGVFYNLASNLGEAYASLRVQWFPYDTTQQPIQQTIQCYFNGETIRENGETVWQFAGEVPGYCKIILDYIPAWPVSDTGADGTYSAQNSNSVPVTVGYTIFESVKIYFYQTGGRMEISSGYGLNSRSYYLSIRNSQNGAFDSLAGDDFSGSTISVTNPIQE